MKKDIRHFFTSDTKKLFVFFDKPLELNEFMWNPTGDDVMTTEHFFNFLEQGLKVNFDLAPILKKLKSY